MTIRNEITGDDVRRIRKGCELNAPTFAKVLGVSERTVRGWEGGGSIPDPMQDLLAAIEAALTKRKRDLEVWAARIRVRFDKVKRDGE